MFQENKTHMCKNSCLFKATGAPTIEPPAQPRSTKVLWLSTLTSKSITYLYSNINYWSMVVSSSFVPSEILVLERWWTGRRSLLKRWTLHIHWSFSDDHQTHAQIHLRNHHVQAQILLLLTLYSSPQWHWVLSVTVSNNGHGICAAPMQKVLYFINKRVN